MQRPLATKTKAVHTTDGSDSSERKRVRVPNAAVGVGCGFCDPDEFRDWPEAENDFAWITACGIHIYGLGIAYLCLTVYLAFATVRLAVACEDGGQTKRSVSLAVLGLLIVAATMRGIFFLVDGYNRNGYFTLTSACLLFHLIYPCVTISFGLHLAALSQLLNSELGRCESRWPVILVGAHFVVTVAVDCFASFVDPRSVLLVVPQTAFAACACVLFSWFLYSYRTFSMLTGEESSGRRASVSRDLSMDSRLGQGFASGLRVLFGSAIAGAFCVILAMFDVINATNRSVTAPWFLWLLGTVERILELVLCASMGCVTSKRYWTLSIALCQAKNSDKTSDRFLKILSSGLPCFWNHSDRTKRSADRRSGRLLRLPWRFLKKRKRLSSCVGSDDSRDVRLTGNGNSGCYVQRSVGSKLSHFCSSASSKGRVGGIDAPETSTIVRRTTERYSEKRPRSSMLINDKGFIRFRLEGDPEGSPVPDSTDDDLEANDRILDRYPLSSEESASKTNTVEMDLCHRFSQNDTSQQGGLACFSEDATTACAPNAVDTPLTPLSLFGSADEASLNVFNFKLPSIHLRESIDRALNAAGSFGRFPAWRSSLDRLSIATPHPTKDDDLRSTSERFVVSPGSGSQPSVSIHGRRSSVAAAMGPELRSSMHTFFRSRPGSRATPRSSIGSLNLSLSDQRYSVLACNDGAKTNLF